MSVSLITGIGEKVRLSRLTTPTTQSVCASVHVCDLYSYLNGGKKVCVAENKCVCLGQR